MGPTFGLLMSIISLLAFWATENPFFAGLAAFNALLNLFNLLPILPLDGGHILKSISFSMNSLMGLAACIAGAAIGVYISYTLGLAFVRFFTAHWQRGNCLRVENPPSKPFASFGQIRADFLDHMVLTNRGRLNWDHMVSGRLRGRYAGAAT